MQNQEALSIASTFLRLRSDASIETLPVNETFWPRLISGELGTFHNEFLVSFYAFDADWPTWEKHPNGDEIGCLLAGSVTFVFEHDTGHRKVTLEESGAFAVIPKDTWHTAKVHRASRMLFITAGEGTQIRPA